MTREHENKIAVAILMIASHFFLMISVIFVYFIGGLSLSEMTTVLGLIWPLFAGYTSVILSFVITNRAAF